MGSPTSLISPQFFAASKLITFLTPSFDSNLSTCSALPSLSLSSPSSLSVSVHLSIRCHATRTDRFHFIVVSVALASPLPVKAVQEARGLVVELNVREAPAEHELLSREVDADSESGANLPILAREHQSFDEYVEEVRANTSPHRIYASDLMVIIDERRKHREGHLRH